MTDHPPCKACGRALVRADGETPFKFARRQTCGTRCQAVVQSRRKAEARAAAIAAHEHPPCAAPGCNKPVEPYKCEPPSHWMNRKTCGRACALALASHHGIATSDDLAAMRPDRPTAKPDFGNGFSAHNIDPGDGGPLRILRPATHVLTANGIA